jgi:monoamine oxidase
LTDRRVIVVGAGFAGLAAAITLTDRGIAVTVFEARERVGGRVWSSTLSNGAVVELGAEWIMEGAATLLGFAERFDLALEPTGTEYLRREPWGAPSLEAQDVFLAAAREARSRLQSGEYADLSLGGFLDGVPGEAAVRKVVKLRLAGTCGVDTDRVALRVCDEEDAFSAGFVRSFRLADGNQRLAEALAAALPDVRTGHIVQGIDRDRSGVLVRMGEHEEHADAAIVAVPAPIAARLRFSPALPDDLREALTDLPMGVASKLAVATNGRPSARSKQHGDLSMWCWAADGAGGKPRECLTAFAGSLEAQEALGTTHGRVSTWLETLRRMNPDLVFEDEPVMYAWADDPYTLGSYAAWDNTSWDRMDRFRRTVGSVAFAGEHTADPEHHGTMNGALLSGQRAAEQVMGMLH